MRKFKCTQCEFVITFMDPDIKVDDEGVGHPSKCSCCGNTESFELIAPVLCRHSLFEGLKCKIIRKQ